MMRHAIASFSKGEAAGRSPNARYSVQAQPAGNGKRTLAQTPLCRAICSASQRATPWLCTTISSADSAEASGARVIAANCSASASSRLLLWMFSTDPPCAHTTLKLVPPLSCDCNEPARSTREPAMTSPCAADSRAARAPPRRFPSLTGGA